MWMLGLLLGLLVGWAQSVLRDFYCPGGWAQIDPFIIYDRCRGGERSIKFLLGPGAIMVERKDGSQFTCRRGYEGAVGPGNFKTTWICHYSIGSLALRFRLVDGRMWIGLCGWNKALLKCPEWHAETDAKER